MGICKSKLKTDNRKNLETKKADDQIIIGQTNQKEMPITSQKNKQNESDVEKQMEKAQPYNQKKKEKASIKTTNTVKNELLQSDVDNQASNTVQKELFSKVFTIDKRIGSGTNSSVYLAQHNITKMWFAVKTIKKTQLSQVDTILKEIKLVHSLDHPNIAKMHEIYQDTQYYYVTMEYCKGGNLLQKVVKGVLNEYYVVNVMTQLLRALKYMHAKDITHGEISPENILFSTTDPDSTIKLIDFNHSLSCHTLTDKKNNELESGLTKQLWYFSPETFNGRHGTQTDIWSCGILTYFLLTGHSPYSEKTPERLIKAIKKGVINWGLDSILNESAKQMIRLMTTFSPLTRPTAQQCLDNQWFKNQVPQKKVNQQVLMNMKQFKREQISQLEIYKLIVGILTPSDELERLSKAFQELDSNNDGKLSRQELMQGFSEIINPVQAEIEVNRIFHNLDGKNNAEINYSRKNFCLQAWTTK